MVPETEIKVSESGTITEMGNKDFLFRDNEYCYLFIYLIIQVWLKFPSHVLKSYIVVVI